MKKNDISINIISSFNHANFVSLLNSSNDLNWKINEVEFLKSEYDGLDLDYSNILINKMLISESGNDCSDFSFGNYTIHESIVDECGDKGFSFGETSKALVKNSLIKN